MNFIKRGTVVSVVAAGLIVGGTGIASADSGHDGDNTNLENNSLVEDVLNGNVIEENLNGNLNGNGNIADNLNGNHVLNDNNVVVDDVLGGGLLD